MKIVMITIAAALAMLTSACATTEVSPAKNLIEEKIYIKSTLHNVRYEFAHSVVKVESRFQPHVIGHGGTYGLGQIKCGTAKGIGFRGECKKLLDPDTNLEYTMIYLRKALDLSKNDECHAATLYNRGLMNKPRPSTYCRKVLSNYK
jgi:soluble lytic murein transglycosylase-like protein